jgi:hypothetical protein
VALVIAIAALAAVAVLLAVLARLEESLLADPQVRAASRPAPLTSRAAAVQVSDAVEAQVAMNTCAPADTQVLDNGVPAGSGVSAGSGASAAVRACAGSGVSAAVRGTYVPSVPVPAAAGTPSGQPLAQLMARLPAPPSASVPPSAPSPSPSSPSAPSPSLPSAPSPPSPSAPSPSLPPAPSPPSPSPSSPSPSPSSPSPSSSAPAAAAFADVEPASMPLLASLSLQGPASAEGVSAA